MKKIRIGDMERAIREEMYNLHAMYVNPDAKEQDFYDRLVPIRTINIKNIPETDIYKLNTHQVERYGETLNQVATKFPVVSGNSLIDGLYRISAAKAQGKSKMDVVDFGNLINPELSGYQLKVKIFHEKTNYLTR